MIITQPYTAERPTVEGHYFVSRPGPGPMRGLYVMELCEVDGHWSWEDPNDDDGWGMDELPEGTEYSGPFEPPMSIL